MPLPDSYTIKPGAVRAYFEAILNAEAPERFSQKFLEGLGFVSSNDRLLIGILKEMGFLNADGKPTDRYYEFLDKTNSARVVADGIKHAYSDLFAVNKDANTLNLEQTYNKLRSLYRGDKKDSVVKNIAKTFVALCGYADFAPRKNFDGEPETQAARKNAVEHEAAAETNRLPDGRKVTAPNHDRTTGIGALQYHINVVLPETRDQAIYDAIFKSMRDHLG